MYPIISYCIIENIKKYIKLKLLNEKNPIMIKEHALQRRTNLLGLHVIERNGTALSIH